VTRHGFRPLGEHVVHEGSVWDVVLADFEAPTGETFQRDIVRSPGAVAVVPVVFDAEGNASVVLVTQYRPPLDEVIAEIPAGMRDVDGEAPAEVARRELREEAGLEAGELELLAEILPSPGMTDSVTSVFMATACTPAETDRQGPEEAAMEVLLQPLDEALSMIERGRIRDAKTVVGLLIAKRRIEAADHG
jgi:ADP-ribose pyrophosphatase